MEQITISITGTGAERHAAALMKAIYKTMARMEDSRCHVTLNTEHIGTEHGEVAIPQFMAPTRKIAQFGR